MCKIILGPGHYSTTCSYRRVRLLTDPLPQTKAWRHPRCCGKSVHILGNCIIPRDNMVRELYIIPLVELSVFNFRINGILGVSIKFIGFRRLISIKMLLIGLTGSIATGKSTVSSLLASEPYALPIVDADILARKVVEPGTRGYDAIVKYFGPTTPDLLVAPSDTVPENGPNDKGRPLNRPALGKRVFGDSEERKRDRAVLNGIVHPAVRWEMFKMVVGCYLRGHWAVVLDIPLLYESGLDRFCGVTMVVGVRDPAIQMQRLTARDSHLSAEDAENRVKSQTDVRVKARRCQEAGGVVLWNDGSHDDLKKQLDIAVKQLRTTSPDWWSWVLLGCPPLAILVGSWRVYQNVKVNRKWEAQTQDQKAKL